MKIPFHKPILPNDVNKILSDSISSGWLTTGPKVKLFEDKLEDYFNVKNVVLLNSCTAALHLCLAAIGLNKNHSFIVPTHTFVASVEVGEYLGAQPILVDINPKTLNIDLDQVESILINDTEKRIKVILPVHFAGNPVDMKRLYSLAEKFNIFILDDAAHATETISNIGKVGKTNYATAFSFYANKNITTGGEGGALTTEDDEIARKVRRLSLHGISKDGWNRFKLGGKWSYDIQELGYKYNMTDIAASFGLDQLSHIDEWHDRRINIVKKYFEGLNNINGLVLPNLVENKKHSWHLFIIQIIPKKWTISRNELIEKLGEYGIGIAVHYKPIHMHSYYIDKYNYKSDDFPQSKRIYESSISIPLYPKLKDEEVEYIIGVLNKLWENYKA